MTPDKPNRLTRFYRMKIIPLLCKLGLHDYWYEALPLPDEPNTLRIVGGRVINKRGQGKCSICGKIKK